MTATEKKIVATLPAAPVASAVSAKVAATAVASKATSTVVTKAAAKPAVKAIAKPVKKAPAKAGPETPVKPKKPKLVRDSFTILKAEYTALEGLKLRATKLARPARKSELIRAGVKALTAMSDAAFLVALKAVPIIKSDHTKKGKGN